MTAEGAPAAGGPDGLVVAGGAAEGGDDVRELGDGLVVAPGDGERLAEPEPRQAVLAAGRGGAGGGGRLLAHGAAHDGEGLVRAPGAQPRPGPPPLGGPPLAVGPAASRGHDGEGFVGQAEAVDGAVEAADALEQFEPGEEGGRQCW